MLKALDDNGLDIFSNQTIAKLFELSTSDVQNYIETLTKNKIIIRLENGKFVRHNFRDKFVIGSFLVEDGIIAYWSALNYYGLTERFPNTVFVQTTKKKSSKEIFGIKYQFVKLSQSKMCGMQSLGFGNHVFKITDVEKTILDCFDFPQYSGDFADLIKAVEKAKMNENKLIEYSKKMRNNACTKRLAYIIAATGKPKFEKFLNYAKSQLTNTYDYFDVFGEKSGKYISEWKLCYNYEEEINSIINTNY